MPRPAGLSRLTTAVAATLLGLALTGCDDGGKNEYEVVQNPSATAPRADAGWRTVDPIAVDLPTDDPITDGATAPDPSAPVLVNIWASWCPPCKKELPLLQEVADSGKLQVVGFSRDTDEGYAAEALEKAGVTYPNWMDGDASLVVALDNRVPLAAVPASFLIRDGKVVAVHVGEFKTRADALAALEQR